MGGGQLSRVQSQSQSQGQSRNPSASASASATPRLVRIDSSTLLPLSPPQIMSPSIESQLLFQDNARVAENASAAGGSAVAVMPLGGGRGGGRSDLESRVSAPTSSSSLNRGSPSSSRRDRGNAQRAVASQQRQQQQQQQQQQQRSSRRGGPTPTTPLSTPKQRFEARREALSKVDQIVKRSWSQRDMSEVKRVASPTMFGARA